MILIHQQLSNVMEFAETDLNSELRYVMMVLAKTNRDAHQIVKEFYLDMFALMEIQALTLSVRKFVETELKRSQKFVMMEMKKTKTNVPHHAN